MFFDGERPYTGGQLVLEEPGGDRVLSERNVWHKFCGRDHVHYNLPHVGTKFSVVVYSQNAAAKERHQSINGGRKGARVSSAPSGDL